ncbi:unnamed protein product [Zymoseptoria tritici ST99CH_3D7]|uniref:Class II aldolase/adducin N-terminal domain-containing protein n=1 Tax=Zymoseptoria tritici (strain ST99CH_3D7) TaxID=1276538 RepID=A0A1X7S377_ZYMT9|nr:unnamed protein product [Zymoseptoria tritici ST99CH_3D7]
MISQDVCYFYKAHSVYDNNGGIAFAADEGSNIAQALGKNKAAILVNHGLITPDEEAASTFRMASDPETLFVECQPSYKLEEYVTADFKI